MGFLAGSYLEVFNGGGAKNENRRFLGRKCDCFERVSISDGVNNRRINYIGSNDKSWRLKDES